MKPLSLNKSHLSPINTILVIEQMTLGYKYIQIFISD